MRSMMAPLMRPGTAMSVAPAGVVRAPMGGL